MGDRLRDWLGLRTLDQNTVDEIQAANARVGSIVSVVVLIMVGVLLASTVLNSESTIPPGYDRVAWYRDHYLLYLLLAAASVGLLACCVLVRKKRVRSPWAIRISVFVFNVAALAFGIYFASIDYGQGGVVVIFATMSVMCSCLFIVIPIVTLLTNAVAVTALFFVMAPAGPIAPTVAANLAFFWAVTVAVSVARYLEKCNAVVMQQEATNRSLHDTLTGLKNRRFLNEEFDRVEEDEMTLAMLDVDDFKFFNDAYGHAVGDSVLVKFANALVSVFSDEACYRSGGDEFLVLERGLSEKEVREQFRRFDEAIQQIHVSGDEYSVSSSAGVIMGHVVGADDLQNMLSAADIAMYDAKRQGKNRVVFRTYSGHALQEAEANSPRMLAYKVEESDPLTGLPNFTHFRNRATRLLQNPKGFEGGMALVYFDIANFKAFNYEYGYEGGDAYLQSLAKVLQQVFPGQLVARLGEDRFLVLTDRKDVAERVTDAHERAHSYQRGITLELKAGICFPEKGERDISSVYDRAKLACDSIKTEYDRVYRIYDAELDTQASRRNHIISSIDEAIEKQWIKVYYQPVVRTQTCRLCSMEALARWEDPSLGVIGPGEFIDVLEQHHLVQKLDLYVVRAVCAGHHDLVQRGIAPVPVSVNLSRIDFETCDIFEEVERLAAEYEVPRCMLHIELTESALTDNSDLIKEQLQRFRHAGYQVWMDDFGSGYSSLNLLEEYDFDVLKIDMLFLRGLEEHEESRIIVSSVVDMAKQLGIQTLAEGVETTEQLDFLREIGCEKLQGYLFSKPRPAEEIQDLIHAGKLTVERYESRRYYAETGRVNIIGRAPVGKDDNEVGADVLLPLAVIEYRDGRLHYLSANESYRKLLFRLGFDSLGEAAGVFDNGFQKQTLTFRQICARVKREGGTRAFDHITRSVHCNTRVNYIASDGDRADAYLICTISDADLTKSPEEATLQETMRFIFSVYARVDVIAEDNSLMENLYLNSGQYNGEFTRSDARTSLIDYAHENIYPEDQARFLAYYDMNTASSRLAAHSLSHLSGFFRTVTVDGYFAWQLYLLIPAGKAGKKLWLSCVRDVDPNAVRFKSNATEVEAEGIVDAFNKLDG